MCAVRSLAALLGVAFAGVVAAGAARADVIQFTFSDGKGDTASWDISSLTPTPFDVEANSAGIDVSNGTETNSLIGTSTVTYISIFDATAGGGVRTGSDATALSGPVIYTGTLSDPTIVPGTYDVTDIDVLPETSGILTITDIPSVPTPEPASLSLLGAGALVMAVCRRRKADRKQTGPRASPA